MSDTPRDLLADLLDQASRGNQLREFYEYLLNARVFVPLGVGAEDIAQQDLAGVHSKFLLVSIDDRTVVPIFSSKELGEAWSDTSFNFVEVEASKVFNRLAEERWVHLNPGAEIGKEFSPWEIELLRQGSQAIDEILSELGFAPTQTVEIDRATTDLEPFKRRLSDILENYSGILEAFLIRVIGSEDNEQSVSLGLRVEEGQKVRTDSLRDEVEAIAREFPEISRVVTVSDVDERSDPNTRLFHNVMPFYVAKRFPSRSLLGTFFGKKRR